MTNSLTSWVYHLKPFPPASSFMAIFALFCYLPYHYHQLNFLYTINTQYYQIQSFLSDYIFSQLLSKQLAIIGYIVIPFLSIMIIISTLYNQDKYQGFKYILSWIGLRIFPFLRILIELNVGIASIFMIIDKYCTILFILAVGINLSSTFFLQNYSNTKDYMCSKSISYIIIFKICLYSNCLLNSVGILYQSQEMINIIMTFRFILDVIMWVLYFFLGSTMFRHFGPRIFIIFLIVLHFAITTSQFADQIFYLTSLYYDSNDLSFGVIIFIVLLPFTYIGYLFREHRSFQKNRTNIRDKCFFLKLKMMNFQSDLDDQSFVRGLISIHNNNQCSNPLCYTKKGEMVYDSRKDKLCDIRKIGLNKSAFSRSLMKCWYEEHLYHTQQTSAILKNSNSTQLPKQDKSMSTKIDYAQLVFSKFKNIYQSLHLVHQYEEVFQFPLNKLRLTRLKQDIQAQNKQLNKQLYNNQLDIQFIIQAQNKFEKIQTLISYVLKRNLQFWEMVHHNKIDLTDLLKTINPNLKTLEEINDNWKQLAKYFDIQKKWKFYYCWFTLYVKNEKLKPMLLEQFSTEVKEDWIFIDSTQEEKENDPHNRLSKIIFEGNSAAIHTNHNALNPQIKKINRYFSKIFGYSEKQIIQSPLAILMTDTVAKIHPKEFHNWAYGGRSNSYPNYAVSQNYVKHKSGNLVTVSKYLKQLVTKESELEYVSLFKKQNQNDSILVASESMQIEGSSSALFQKMNLQTIWQNLSQMYQINLLLMMPMLIKYSSFDKFFNSRHEQLFEIQTQADKKSYRNFRKQSISHYIGNNIPTQNQNVSNSAKTVSSVKLFAKFRVPKNIKEIVSFLVQKGYSSKSLQKKFKLLEEAIRIRSESKFNIQFECEIQIVTKSFPDHKYHEIKFLSLQSLQQSSITQNLSLYRRKVKVQEANLQVSNFHKFFQSKQSGQTYSLQASNNIFIKQEVNRPVYKLVFITRLQKIFRVFFFIILVVSLTSLIYNVFVSFSQYNKVGNQLLIMNNFQLSVSQFQTNLYNLHYYNSPQLSPAFNNSEFLDDSMKKLKTSFNNIQNLKELSGLKYSLFDYKINDKAIYYPTQIPGYYFTLKNATYSQTDLPLKIFQLAEDIIKAPINTLSLSNVPVISFQSLLTPSFHVLCQTNRNNILNKLENITNNIRNTITIIMIFQGVIILGIFILAIFKISKIVRSFISMMEVYTQFNQQDIEKIYKYCHFLIVHFKHLRNKDRIQKQLPNQTQNPDQKQDKDQPNNLTFTNTFQDVSNNNININKKIKKVQIGSVLNRLRITTYILIILSLLIFVAGCMYCSIMIRTKSQSVQKLYILGHQHFNYYSTLTIIQSAAQKKYWNSAAQSQQFKAFYIDQINDLLAMKSNKTRLLPQAQNFSFTQTYNKVYFENTCKQFYNQLQGDSDVSKCQQVASNSLKYGIESYVYYITDTVISYLNGSLDLVYGDINGYGMGLYYVNIFMNYLGSYWYRQLKWSISSYQQEIVIVTMGVLGSFGLMYFILFQILVIKGLKKRFCNLRNIYEMYMPDYLITKQKIIKAKLIIDGIVNK